MSIVVGGPMHLNVGQDLNGTLEDNVVSFVSAHDYYLDLTQALI